MKDFFPTVGQNIVGRVPEVRRHYSGKCESQDDLQARVLATRELQVRRAGDEWKTRAVLPSRTYVVGYGRLQ